MGCVLPLAWGSCDLLVGASQFMTRDINRGLFLCVKIMVKTESDPSVHNSTLTGQ